MFMFNVLWCSQELLFTKKNGNMKDLKKNMERNINNNNNNNNINFN